MGIQNQTTSATTQASFIKCSGRLPRIEGSSMPVSQGTRLVLGKITSRVIRKLLPAQRLAHVGRRRGKPESRLGTDLGAIALVKQRRNFSNQFAARF
ncbi:Uncharacterised protein [Raoultella terrigena]|nr:Uncharacterised protein [Raoultella terrigena]